MNIILNNYVSYNHPNKKRPSFGTDVSQVDDVLKPYIAANISKLSVKINKDELTCFRIVKCKFKTITDRLGRKHDNLIVRTKIISSGNGNKSLVLTLGEKAYGEFYPLAVFKNFNNNLVESLLKIAEKLEKIDEKTFRQLRAKALINANN